jgi:hypothetical protein
LAIGLMIASVKADIALHHLEDCLSRRGLASQYPGGPGRTALPVALTRRMKRTS